MYDAKEGLKGYAGMGVNAGVPEFYEDVKNKYVLELGYGSGDLLKQLEDMQNTTVGIDASKVNYIIAREKGVKGLLLRSDLSKERLPFVDDVFDAAFCFEIIEHLENPVFCLQELARVVKKMGTIYLSIPIPEKIMGYKQGRHAYAYPGLCEKKNFDRFLMQFFFRFDDYYVEGYHAYYKVYNVKKDRMCVQDVINNDVDGNEYYGDLNWGDRVIIEPVEKGPHDQ